MKDMESITVNEYIESIYPTGVFDTNGTILKPFKRNLNGKLSKAFLEGYTLAREQEIKKINI